MANIGELVEKLAIANIKLFQVCDQKADMARNPADFSKEEMASVMAKDIELCKERARLKNEINRAFDSSIAIEVKDYGT